ncbi:hypothetical protein [Tenacibaculum maritimum]|uniref:hypothetical protein n=1 Tax=Tenacibaculum maritimum TaxID=107401 RepID=UPI0012E65EAC|nr:hypothetical protein [Tenacibaculum maritimum]CAA0193620.1 conserved hypothetical protein [Tenacibaculum maritimum]
MKKIELTDLNNLNGNYLNEFQAWKEKQEALVRDNLFVNVTDNKSYQEAKRCRTALVKGRTEIEKQDKLVASKIKEFRNKVLEISNELIKITKPHEDKQQAEVKRYEDLKAKEKAEKERIEVERKKKIKTSIEEIFKNCSLAIKNLKYEYLEKFNMLNELQEFDTSKFEEFELDFAEKLQILTNLFNDKKQQLEISEKQKLEDERLKKEREALEEDKRIAREKAEKEAEEKRKEQERIDAENKRKADELAKKEAELEEDKKRLAKIEADRKAKEEVERKAKEEAKRKEEEEARKKAEEEERQKRIEALRPDKEKLQKVIDSISVNSEIPILKNKDAVKFYNRLKVEVSFMKKNLSNSLKSLT